MKGLKFATLFLASPAFSFVPQGGRTQVALSLNANKGPIPQFDPLQLANQEDATTTNSLEEPKLDSEIKALALAALAIGTPASASAATAFAPNAIPAALAAYGHYISLFGILGCVLIERLTIKANMSEKEEDFVAATDIAFGLWGTLNVYTGYLRTSAYEKGFDFYSHEPLFWLKICFLGIFGASSFFNTTTIIQRAVAKRNGEFEPMTEKLATRMKKICNAELVALGIIPLAATLMARGVLYSESIPWQAEAGLDAAIFVGLSYKYIKEALTFEA